MGTARDLTITTWPADAEDQPLVLSVPGLKLTGWWPGDPPSLQVFDALKVIWPTQSAVLKIERDILEDGDGKKHQVCAYVRIRQYPDHWRDTVRSALKFLVENGAAIAWAGGWDCFLQYLPYEKFAGCYAAFTEATDLICLSDLDEPIRYLDRVPAVVARLHAAVRQVVLSEA